MERRWFTAPIEQKALSDDGPGEISGYASTYGNVDLQDDVMERGALDRTITHWQGSKAKVPLLDWHGDSISRLIGSVAEMKSTQQGLWFRAGFSSDAAAQAARQKAKEGHLSGVSIGYMPIRESLKQIGDKTVRVLHEVRLLEISLTPVPANPQAQLASVKSVGETTSVPAGLSFDQLADATLKAAALPNAAYKAAMAALLADYHPTDDAPGPVDEPEPTAPAPAADDGGTAPTTGAEAERAELRGRIGDATAYALRIISPDPRDGALGGNPPPVALAGPLAPLELAKALGELDQLEAELKAQKGTATA